MTATVNIHDATDFIIQHMGDAGSQVTLLKLQKLLFYVQAWHLATRQAPLFDERFQAWVHGPVSRQVYDRFRESHGMYDIVGREVVRAGFDPNALPEDVREHIGEVLEAYAPLTGSQLESLTHSEQPWIAARGQAKPNERCEREIDEALMQKFYSNALAEAEAASEAV